MKRRCIEVKKLIVNWNASSEILNSWVKQGWVVDEFCDFLRIPLLIHVPTADIIFKEISEKNISEGNIKLTVEFQKKISGNTVNAILNSMLKNVKHFKALSEIFGINKNLKTIYESSNNTMTVIILE